MLTVIVAAATADITGQHVLHIRLQGLGGFQVLLLPPDLAAGLQPAFVVVCEALAACLRDLQCLGAVSACRVCNTSAGNEQLG